MEPVKFLVKFSKSELPLAKNNLMDFVKVIVLFNVTQLSYKVVVRVFLV